MVKQEGVVPRRLTYPQSEATINAPHYSEATSGLSVGNTVTPRIWWDKQ
jgi:hypothetical protein